MARDKFGYRKPANAPTEKPTSHDIAWAAGIYEGEGHIEYDRCEAVRIGQNGPWLPERLRALFGGRVSARPSRSNFYIWISSGARARGFIMSVYGLLSPRRQLQARKAMRIGEFT